MTAASSLARRAGAEFLGAALLLATVVGSGIMAERIAGGNVAIALLCNSLATGAMLTVLITMLAPLSGAHLNPAVTTAFVIRGDLSLRDGIGYVGAQITGAFVGVVAAHAMFELPPMQTATTARDGVALGFSELVATFGLMITILMTIRVRPEAVAPAVGLYIVAAYWFTASTSFANPAVTLARGMTDTFAGIAPASIPLFIGAQFAGALAALAVVHFLAVPAASSAR